jgi:protein-tyrosine kinase
MNELASSAGLDRSRSLLRDVDKLPLIEISREELDRHLIVGFDSFDPRSRPYTLLRTQLTKLMDAQGLQMIGITSATPAAGKTFTSVNLAAALSKMEGRRVLLCDFDLRRGSMLDMFGIEVEHALNDYLKGTIDDCSSAIYGVNNHNLLILPTRSTMRDSSENLSSERFQRLIAQLQDLPDDFIVICDLPPVFANDDAMLCMQHLTAYLLVVDHGRTTARQVEESTNLLAPAVCLGTVLNRYHGGFGDDFGYGYGDVYGLKNYTKSTE